MSRSGVRRNTWLTTDSGSVTRRRVKSTPCVTHLWQSWPKVEECTHRWLVPASDPCPAAALAAATAAAVPPVLPVDHHAERSESMAVLPAVRALTPPRSAAAPPPPLVPRPPAAAAPPALLGSALRPGVGSEASCLQKGHSRREDSHWSTQALREEGCQETESGAGARAAAGSGEVR